MSEQYPGGFINKTAPTLNPALGNAAPGVWNMTQVQQAIKAGTWPAYDPYYKNVVLNLHGDGTNGAQNNTFLDSSTNNFTITRNGNTTQGTFTPYGSNWSNYFDGSSYLRVTSATALTLGSGDFCIEMWIYPTAGGSNPLIWGEGPDVGSNNMNIHYNISGNGTIQVYIDAFSGSSVMQSSVISQNTWTHVAVTRSGSTFRLFINGTQSSTYSNAGSVNSGDLRIGASYVGYISNSRTVKGSAIYTSNFTPSTTPLTAITNTSLLTCQSNRFIDNSTNAFTVTPNGSPSVQRFSPFSPTTAYSTSVIGGSGYFDGSGDNLSIASNANLAIGTGQYTAEFWIYFNSVTALNEFFECTTTGNTGCFTFYFNGTNALQVVATGGAGPTTVTWAPTTGQWYHIAATRDSSNNQRIFANGVLLGTATSTNNYGQNGFRLFSGTHNGYITDARLIVGSCLYTSAFTPPTAPLTAVSGTQMLMSYTNAGILDNAIMNDLETVGNAQISTSVKKYGTGSMYFDGTGDGLIANGVSSSGAYNKLTASGVVNTVEFWLYVNSFTSPRAFLCGSWASSVGWTYDVNTSGDIFISTDGSGPTVTLSSKITTGAWQHVAFVNDGTNIKIYLNGTNVGTQAVAAPSSYVGPLTVGMRSDSALPLNGYIDDLRITKGVARYTANFTAPTSQLQDQ